MFPTDGPKTDSLAGRVLAADPALVDPNFREALIFLAEHDPGGAFGLIVNRPTGRVLGDLVSDVPLSPAAAAIPLHLGGPVSPGSILVAVFQREPGKGLRCRLTSDMEEVEPRLDEDGAWVRAFAGYSGWGGGQLEGELQQESWRVRTAHPVLFNPRYLSSLWSVYIDEDTRWQNLTEHLPDDPSLN